MFIAAPLLSLAAAYIVARTIRSVYTEYRRSVIARRVAERKARRVSAR